jgi:LysM repeat protein
MEDNTQLSGAESSGKSEKTVVMSSNPKTENSTSKEQGNGPEGDSVKEKEQAADTTNNPNSKSSDEFIKDSQSKRSVAPIIAAGVAGAAATGAAGVALGATYSEEIKEVVGNPFEAEETSSEEVPLAEASVTEDENVQQVSVTTETEMNLDGMSSLEISGMDQEGNVYSVSFLDFDGDGESDVQTAEFQSVDGVTVTFTEYGNSLDSLFTEDFLLAENTDYVDCGYCGVQEVSMMDSYLYEIQPGDTLSEIASANNTTVAHLMELNPQISDPDLIYAGSNMIIPDGDSGVYPLNSGPDTFIGEGFDDSMFVEEDYYISEEQTETPSGEFVAIDWESFYDNPVDNPYTNELEGMDFEAMETPQSYYESDYGTGDFGFEESGFGFL